jgi:hypothetical protein
MGYIFESEITMIIHGVLARTIGEDDNIRLRRVLTSDIHPALKAYVRAEVEKLLQQERQEEIRSKRFPYLLPEVAGLQRQIDLLLVQEYEFTRGEFEAMVDEAVHFQFNYLCRPQWTMMSLMFENRRTVSATDIERKLRYCVDYQYFNRVIRRYLVDRGLAEVGYEEFRDALEKIDREVIAQHSPLELARMTRPLLSFIEAGFPHEKKVLPEPSLPINAAIVFFEDKRLLEIKNELERMRDAEEKGEISISQLALVIERTRGIAAPLSSAENDKAASVENSSSGHILELKEALPDAQQTFPSGDADEEMFDAIPPIAEAKVEFPSQPLVEVYSLFSSADRKMAVRKIFKKDEVSFRNAIDELEPIKTWDEASLVLDAIFQANNVDPFSKEAIRFTDIIQSRYAHQPSSEHPSSERSVRTPLESPSDLRDKSALG